jgi:hypothetical protein
MGIIGKTVRGEVASLRLGSDYEGDEQEEHADYDGGEGYF